MRTGFATLRPGWLSSVNSFLRRIGAEVLQSVGYYRALRRIDARRGRRLLILMYHDLIPAAVRAAGATIDDDSPTVEDFAETLDTVTRRFRVVTLRDAVAELCEGGLRDDAVSITFDDGYASAYEHAFPLLEQGGVPATVFVLTGWVSREMSYWWHRLRGLVAHAPFDDFDPRALGALLGISLPENAPPGSRDFRVALARSAEERLRDQDDAARRVLLDRIRDLLLPDGGEAPDDGCALNWDQLRAMTNAGFELAAHTHAHVNFSYASPDVVRSEAARSKRHIEEQTGASVVGFAYPYGKDIDRYREFYSVLEEEGFRYACTAVGGNNRDNHDMMSLRRVTPPTTRSAALIEHTISRAFVRDDSFFDLSPPDDS